jgi:hypothetical protein
MRKSTMKIFIMVLFLAAVVSLGAYAAGGIEEKIDKRVQQDPQGASCCAGGYDSRGTGSNLREDDIKKLREERSLFLQKIEPLRQSYYEKSVTLRDELGKKNPDAEIAARMQGDISDLRAQLADEQTKYIIKVKKINPNLLQGSCNSATSNKSSIGASCCQE